MKMFLTSSPHDSSDGSIIERNDFKARFLEATANARNALFIASSPDDKEGTAYYRDTVWESFVENGMPLESFEILDNETKGMAARLIKKADLICLAGGHVPTQNAFFNSFPLAKLLSKFKGVLLATSAGSMNAAETVYSQPEEEGESLDPEYKRFLKGLGLTKVSILPHYQAVKDEILDGQRLFEDITFPDSFGHTFFVFPDGTYILKDEDGERIYGECWTIHDGKMTKISEDGEEVWVEKE